MAKTNKILAGIIGISIALVFLFATDYLLYSKNAPEPSPLFDQQYSDTVGVVLIIAFFGISVSAAAFYSKS